MRHAVRSVIGCVFALAAFAAGPAPEAQPLPPLAPDTTAAVYGASTAFVVRLDQSGFGLGTAARARLTDDLSLTMEVAAGAAKDPREQQFFVGFFGDTVTPLKRNYALLLPLHVGLERRLFRESVESNFRPFAALAGGPAVALQWPYFDDVDGDGVLGEGEERLGVFRGLGDVDPRVGVGGSTTLGAYFGSGTQRSQGLRFGFTAHYFPSEVELLEPRPEVESPSRRWFVTPVVSFHLVRLLD